MSENFFASSFCRRLHDEMACIIVRNGCRAYLSSCRQPATDANHWMIRTLFIAMTTFA